MMLLAGLAQLWNVAQRSCKREAVTETKSADVAEGEPADDVDADAEAEAEDPVIEEMLEQFIQESEDQFYDKLRKEVEIYRQELTAQAAVSAKEAAMIEEDLAAREADQPKQPRRRRNRSF